VTLATLGLEEVRPPLQTGKHNGTEQGEKVKHMS